MSTVLIDCGNSTVQVAWSGAGIEDLATIGDELAFRDWLAGRSPTGARIAWSNPLGGQLARDWCAGAGLRVEAVGEDLPLPSLGQYVGCGVDRILAGLACCGREAGIVIDAGTATTLTAWNHADGAPVFAGGLILPGAEACRRGLQHLVPRLPAVALDLSPTEAAQQSTEGALRAGLAVGVPAMVAGCLSRLGQETGLERICLTGGGGPSLAVHFPQAQLYPDAVLQGLASL